MSVSKEQLQELCRERSEIVSEFKGVILGNDKKHRDLQKRCLELGVKSCTSLSCCKGVRPLAEFNVDNKSSDGRQPKCKQCCNSKEATGAAKAQKRKSRELVKARGAQKDSVGTETAAMKALLPMLRELGYEACDTPEFRRADLVVRRTEWPPDLYLCLQLKSDGELRDDGTPKPNDSLNHGGRAGFHSCTGYEGMVVLFVKTRRNEDGELVWVFWAIDGGTITKQIQNEHVDGTLGTDRLSRVKLADVLEKFAPIDPTNAPLKLCTWDDMFWDITDLKQRKEVAFMVATKAVGRVEFIGGNQNHTDCLLDGLRTQAKTHNLKAGGANMRCQRNGVANQPYNADDEIDQALVGCIVKSSDRFLLLYALLSRDELLKAGVWAHEGYRGRARSDGHTSVYVRGGIFERWLTEYTNGPANKHTGWLKRPENSWRTPVELTDEVCNNIGLPLQVRNEAAQPVARPDLAPTPKELAAHEERLQQRLDCLKAAADRRAAEAAADRAQAAADRAETAAAAGPSTVNNITNNVTINFPQSTEPPAKRLKQLGIAAFLG